jgi:hypothetical protein
MMLRVRRRTEAARIFWVARKAEFSYVDCSISNKTSHEKVYVAEHM